MRKKRRWDEEFCKMCEKKGGLGGKLGCFAVAPYAGAWIEILDNLSSDVLPDGSLPTRERLPTPRFNNLSEPFAK